MAGPMPPGAPPPDAAPHGPPQGPPQGDQAGNGGIEQLMSKVGEALEHIAQTVASSNAASPQEKQMIQQCSQMFHQFVESVSGGAGDEPEGEGQGQTVPPEAGGNKGAIPSPV